MCIKFKYEFSALHWKVCSEIGYIKTSEKSAESNLSS